MEKTASKIISIVGPTGAGKSEVVLGMAVRLLEMGRLKRVLLISADSRQVYRGLEITSGADIPSSYQAVEVKGIASPLFKHPDLELYIAGLAIIPVTQEWSAAHFQQLVWDAVTHFSRNLDGVFMVGGTMLYHQVIDRPETAQQPGPDPELREKASSMTITQQQEWLASINKSALEKLNNSDRNNPRRLIRAIERALSLQKGSSVINGKLPVWNGSHLWAGILPEKAIIETSIEKRVRARLAAGSLDELMAMRVILGDSGLPANRLPAYSTCGVREMMALEDGESTFEACVQAWALSEKRYVKRQLTWWKKQEEINWFDTKDGLATWIGAQYV